MKFLRSFGLGAIMAVLAATSPAAASATELKTAFSLMVTSGSTLSAESEGSQVFSFPFGSIECTGSSLSAKTSNTGGASETVNATVEALTFTGCSAPVTVLAKGTLEIHTQEGSPNNNGSITSTGAEVTIEKAGLHCIYKTSSTKIGTLTGSATTGKTATYDIAATVPRTGGKAGVFCGSTGEWKGSYNVTTPDILNVDGAPPPPAVTTLTTSLSGEEKSGEEVTVNEGAKVKDQATLSGENAATATGTIKYAVYSDNKCEKLVTKAGETAFSEGKVPASEEKTLEAGSVYYWQAEYTGDSKNAASKSSCGKEVLTIKAATTLTTSLSGEEKSGEEVTVNEGSKVKDTATLSGTKSSTATGKGKYKVYADKECKELVTEAGEVTVSGGSVPASEEKTLEAGRVYYWQATYEGDTLHQASTGTCGKEVETVKAQTSLATLLAGENPGGEEAVEGEEITVPQGPPVVDSATLSGTKASTATGKVSFKVYADSKCKELLTEAGEVSVEEGSAGPSEEVELEEGSYYWQASYEGDPLHQASTSPCTEVAHVVAATSLTTTLSGEAEEGEVIQVSEEALVVDTATLSGAKAAEATGSVEYFVYEDEECEELVTEAGEVTVAGEGVPASSGVTLEPGLYYWQAVYSGDGLNHASTSPCGSEVEMVLPRVTTTLSGGGNSAGSIKVTEGTLVHDEATLRGEHASEATGNVEYLVYADEECEELVAEAGEVEVEGSEVPPSEEVELEAPGSYYWQADYSGDEQNPAATSDCGSEVSTVMVPTSLTTSLSGGETEGAEISVEEGTPVSDQATLSGAETASAAGSVTYTVYEDSGCTEVAAAESVVEVEEGVAEASSEVTLPPGTYYWQAEYWGDGVNAEALEECGTEVEHVTAPITTSLSGGEEEGTELSVEEGTPVTDQATLHGEHAGEATGSIEYLVYSDAECEELFAEAGDFEFEEGKVPASNSVEFEESGIYYWRAKYSGDGKNPAATSPCGSEFVQVMDPNWQYAAFGNSYSSGEGVRWYNCTKASFYDKTNTWKPYNACHRSEQAWPALIAEKAFGKPAIQPPIVFEPSARFIFRACSGAVTDNVSGPGLYDEWEEPGKKQPGKWVPKPSQLSWLPAKGKVERVSVGIGGNDAGFAPIVKACWSFSRAWFSKPKYDPASCQKEIKDWEGAKFAQVKDHLQKILEAIAKQAPQAQIKVFLYPRVLNLKVQEISIGKGLVINNKVPGENKETAADSIETYIGNLNNTIKEAVDAAVKAKVKADAIASTQGAFTNHLLGDKEPWLNGVTVPPVESFHPGLCGQQAVAALAGPELGLKKGAITPCP